MTDSLAFDRIADIYDETRGGEERGHRFARDLDPLLTREELVVEIGIGTGVIALGLQELGFRVVGVDLGFAVAKRAAERIGARVAVADARRLPFADGSVAQALSVWVLHVVGDAEAVLREVARVLTPDGRYLVVPALGARPNEADPIGRAIWDMQQRLDREGRRRDAEQDLARHAEAAGLRVVERRTWRAHDYEESPAQAIRKIETRSYSLLWDLPDDGWRHAVEPTLQQLRSLPDPERPIKRTSTDRVMVFAKGVTR